MAFCTHPDLAPAPHKIGLLKDFLWVDPAKGSRTEGTSHHVAIEEKNRKRIVRKDVGSEKIKRHEMEIKEDIENI